MLQLEREILFEISAFVEPVGILKVGVSESFCYQELPKMMANFRINTSESVCKTYICSFYFYIDVSRILNGWY